MSRKALGSEHASQFSTNQSIVTEFRRALCFQATKSLICKKVCFKLSRKFQVKKRFDRPRRLLPGSVGSSFKVHMYWYVMKNLMCQMCSLCSCEDLTLQGTDSKSNLINYRWAISRNYTLQLYEHIHVVNRNLLDLLAVAAYLLNFEYDSTTTTL